MIWCLTYRSQVSLLRSQSVLLAWMGSRLEIPSLRSLLVVLPLWNSFIPIYMVRFPLLQMGTSTGSHSLMMPPGTDAAGSSIIRVRPLLPSSITRLGQKSRLGRLSNRFGMIKEGSICLISGRLLCWSMESRDSTLQEPHHSRMVLLNALIGF